jgi:trafficking protein particle complex subunit 4
MQVLNHPGKPPRSCLKLTIELPRPVFALLIISKAGSLIYNRTFSPGLQSLTTNDYLVLAGTFHGVHAITKSLTPRIPTSNPNSTTRTGSYTHPDPTLPATGIETLESSFFRLNVFQTLTGTKFLLFSDPSMQGTETLMKGVYERFADFVCKNPFWQTEMPIRIEAWDRSLTGWLGRR